MKVLLFGHNGWIGSKVLSILDEKSIVVIKGKSRIDNIEDLENEILEFTPTHIITTTGRTSGVHNGINYNTIDYLENDGKIVENLRDNLYGPLCLANLCKKYKIHLTYLGTGCIFHYDETHKFGEDKNGFTENDEPNFFGSSYSVVKGYTDKLMHQYDDTVLNVRIRMPITAENNPKNFITKILNYKYICSIPNSMTVLDELLPIMIDMLSKNTTGTINLVNPGLISHNEILEMYKEYIDPNYKWHNFSIDEQNKILLAKRSNNYLDTEKLVKLYPNVQNIKESVRNCIMKMKNQETKVL